MNAFTFYVDESGSLVRRGDGATLGLRAVGGLLLRGEVDEHDPALRPLLQVARDWLPELAHAADLSVFRLAETLRGMDRTQVPLHLKTLAVDLLLGDVKLGHLRVEGHPWRDRLLEEAARLKRGLGQAAGLACNHFAGVAVAALEHDTSPEVSRYGDMLHAALWGACLHLRRCGLQSAALHAVVERGAAGWESVSPGALEARLLEETGVTSKVGFFAKNAHPGLSLADTALHQLAPRRFAHAPLDARAQGETLRVVEHAQRTLGARLAASVDSVSLPSILACESAQRVAHVDTLLTAPLPGSVRMALLSTRQLLRGGSPS